MSSPTVATPRWLVESQPGLGPCGCVGRRRKGSFVARTLGGATALVRQAMFSDEVARRPGLLQRLDPRVKLVSLVGLLLTASLVHHIPVVLALYLGTLVLAGLSKLPIGSFVMRVWLFIPVFTGIVVLPATFSFVTHGRIVVPLWHWSGSPVGLTAQGLTAAGLIVARVATSISLVVLLTVTTPWNRLLAALRALFVPPMFVLVLGMAYRYIFHLLDAVTDMYTARQARTVDVAHGASSGRAFVAASAGALFGKAHALSDEVHQAMVSRGYTGHARSVHDARIAARDGAWLIGCALVALAAMGGDRALAR